MLLNKFIKERGQLNEYKYFELGAVLLAGVFFAIIYFLGKVKKYDFGLLTILGLVFGVAVGLIFKGHYLYLEAIGTIYSHLILAIVIRYYYSVLFQVLQI